MQNNGKHDKPNPTKNGNTVWQRMQQGWSRPRLKDHKKEILFAELHSLFAAGLDFSRAFELLISAEADPKVRALYEDLFCSVVRGSTLASALSESGHFSALDCGVIRIGEETGGLDESLVFLSDFYRKKNEHRRMVSGAVSYPLIILCVAVVVVVFMILVIVPMFEQVYSRMGGELPGITQAIIGLSKQFPAYMGVGVFVVMGIGLLLYSIRDREFFRKTSAAFMLGLPGVGAILRKNYQSRYCKLLYLLTGAGVPLLQSIAMLEKIITFYPYQESFASICKGLNRGESFSDNMARHTRIYDLKLITLIRVGEETNRLPQMLRKQSEDLTQELEFQLKQLGNMLEPVLILFVGILVAVILISMYLPMFKLGGIMY